MFALVEFDSVIPVEAYDKLKELYDFGKTKTRIGSKLYAEYVVLGDDDYFLEDVRKVVNETGEVEYFDSVSNEPVMSYHVFEQRVNGMVGIENTKHLVNLEELYKVCRKIQVKILEVAF